MFDDYLERFYLKTINMLAHICSDCAFNIHLIMELSSSLPPELKYISKKLMQRYFDWRTSPGLEDLRVMT